MLHQEVLVLNGGSKQLPHGGSFRRPTHGKTIRSDNFVHGLGRSDSNEVNPLVLYLIDHVRAQEASKLTEELLSAANRPSLGTTRDMMASLEIL